MLVSAEFLPRCDICWTKAAQLALVCSLTRLAFLVSTYTLHTRARLQTPVILSVWIYFTSWNPRLARAAWWASWSRTGWLSTPQSEQPHVQQAAW